MGKVVYAAAMSHVLFPDYYGKNVGPHGRRMVEELIAVVREMGRDMVAARPDACAGPILRGDGPGRSCRGGVGNGMSRYEVNVLLYRLKKDSAFRRRFRDDAHGALSGAELTDEEREAFVTWDTLRLNELGGSLHLLISIPGLGEH